MSTLIFDIETIGHDFDSFDKITQDALTHWIKRESESEEEYQESLKELKEGLGFSPLTGEIVVIGTLDYEKNQGGIYFQAPGENIADSTEEGMEPAPSTAVEGIRVGLDVKESAPPMLSDRRDFSANIKFKFRQMTEYEMLEHFWKQIAPQYNQFVSFNGRCFDGPFLMIRSAYHGIKPTKNLSESRYFYQQKSCVHIDLLDQLTFQGNLRKKGSLHLWSRLFGIKSPKEDGVTGNDVAQLFKDKKFIDIAKYNAGDLRATRELYEKWNTYLSG